MSHPSKLFINPYNQQQLSKNSSNRKYSAVRIIIPLLMAFGFGLRVWGVGYGLPYFYNSDEPFVQISLTMVKTGNLNPNFFGYGSLFFYVNAVVYWVYYLFGKLLGLFQSVSDIPDLQMLGLGIGITHMPSQIIAPRMVSIMMGTLCIPVTYWLGMRLSGWSTGLLTAVFVTISAPLVNHSQLITPNIQTTLLILITLAVLVWSDTKNPNVSSILIGLSFGLAIASKYNAALLIIPIGLTYYLRDGWSMFFKPGLYISGIVTGLSFLAATPYAILDFNTFWNDTLLHLQYYRVASHPGMEGNTIGFYLKYLFRQEGLIVFLSIVPVIGYLKSRQPVGLILASFAIPYVLYIFSLDVRNDRTILITLPVLLIMAADVCSRVWQWLQSNERYRLSGMALLAIFVTLSNGYLLYMAIDSNITKTTPDGRDIALQWIDTSIPAGSRIAIESYAPYIDPARYDVAYFDLLTENSPDWYIEQGYDWLIFSSGRFDRYFRVPERYGEQVALYNALWASFSAAMVFDQNGMIIRIFQVSP